MVKSNVVKSVFLRKQDFQVKRNTPWENKMQQLVPDFAVLILFGNQRSFYRKLTDQNPVHNIRCCAPPMSCCSRI